MLRESDAGGNRFDAVILDLTVPGAGGPGGHGAPAGDGRRGPGIVSSRYSGDPVLSRHEAYGFPGRIAKPYSGSELSRVLWQVLEGDPAAGTIRRPGRRPEEAGRRRA